VNQPEIRETAHAQSQRTPVPCRDRKRHEPGEIPSVHGRREHQQKTEIILEKFSHRTAAPEKPKQASSERLEDPLKRVRPRLAISYRLEFKNCFGAVAGYVNGNIFVSRGKFGLALRLPPQTLTELFAEADVSPLKYFKKGHAKKEYAVIPNGSSTITADLRSSWIKVSNSRYRCRLSLDHRRREDLTDPGKITLRGLHLSEQQYLRRIAEHF
jgi:hypothetical protein